MGLGHREPFKGFTEAGEAGNGPGTSPERVGGLRQIASGQPFPSRRGGPSPSPWARLFVTRCLLSKPLAGCFHSHSTGTKCCWCLIFLALRRLSFYLKNDFFMYLFDVMREQKAS